MQIPVATRSKGAAAVAGSTASSSALASAPAAADAANRRRGSMRSGSPRMALARQPMTKPACTPLVSAAWKKCERWNSAVRAGVTAEAENHSAIAATWDTATMVTEMRFDAAQVANTLAPSAVAAKADAHSARDRHAYALRIRHR